MRAGRFFFCKMNTSLLLCVCVCVRKNQSTVIDFVIDISLSDTFNSHFLLSSEIYLILSFDVQ